MSEKEKNVIDNLKEKLFYNPENCGEVLEQNQIDQATDFCEDYKKYIDASKTEREAAALSISMLEKQGFVQFNKNKKYNPGDKVYYNNRGKAVIAAVIGTKSIDQGAKVIASHIDSPRLDLKPRPLYEDGKIALFKTHYYGGIKKYQWTAIPLAIHGVIIKNDGTSINVCIGEDDNDPIFCVNDLLPHLANSQADRKMTEVIKGEELNVMIGSLPYKGEKTSPIKLNILNLLNQKYGIVESDFISAELEVVPAYKARDVGFDRSMLAAYGHDDRVCAYTSLKAILECEKPEYTAVCILADKEETGSNSSTGLDTSYFKYFISDLAKPYGVEGRTVLSNSKCLSADVNAAFDPTFPSVLEKNNAAYINYGVVLTKYTGSRGKSGTSDASAEFMGEVTRLFNNNGVKWQSAELGKVDEGGGGTVAMFLAALDMDVVDIGVAVLSMHAPYEVVSKLDTFMAYKAFSAFYGN